ncbi:IS3 family transposase (plasmid) [Rhizobium sp. CB3171]|uniref:IS3 family transposase n=1 Tax=Rhizobium sp. CB3171 TaxID=3039157 RepID=UPI0024B19463|nr:IS3 family transposase [Rhizobium sp. CB3171]WFU06675.1 IS3 family transposase [Rhizobium sp. CB3171]
MEVLSGPERRRRWSTAEKLAIIHETYEADATVSIVARRHGIQPNQLFAWRKLASQGALTATAAEEEVVPASEYRALQAQVKELQRLLGKKTMESEILKEALEIAGGPKNICCARSLPRGFWNEDRLRNFGCRPLEYRRARRRLPSKARGRPPLPDRELLEDIKAVIADTPTYGYRRVHAILRRNARKLGRSWPNAKRVYRVMKLHNLLLVRHTGAVNDRLHDGRVAVERSNIRWCSDGFEIGCDNKEKVRVAFALDCCDREAIAHVATTEGIKSEDVQDLVITAVENRFGRINMLSEPIEWLTDNGSCFIARDTASLLRDIGMEPCTTPVRSPQSNGMAEAFVKTFKRDYVSVNPTPDAETVIAQLPFWFEHYNNLHPHSALGYQSPREFISSQSQT